MTVKGFKDSIQNFQGKTLTKHDINQIAKIYESHIQQALYEGWEIWEPTCRLRLKSGSGDKDFTVHNYNDPLHAEKEYSTLDGALHFMDKEEL